MAQSYKQIQAEIARLQNQAEKLRKQEAAEVIAKMRTAIEHYGLTAADLGFGKNGKGIKKSKSNRQTYRNEAGQTWAGWGMKPSWLQAALKAGRKLEEFKA
jgi:DNA-binding protein H-NS